jgi:hypothetical protein
MSSVRQSWWNDRKKATPSGCSDQFTSSAKSSHNLRFTTQRFRKYFTVYSSLPGSFATTSTHTISWWSPTSYWRISSTIGRYRAHLQVGSGAGSPYTRLQALDMSHPKIFNFRMWMSFTICSSINRIFWKFSKFFWRLFSFFVELNPLIGKS